MRKKHEIDMTQGPVLKQVIMFAIPLMITGILQLLFNAADTIVVGKFASSTALAAVGSTGSLVSLLVNLFMGISTGSNVLVARYFGSRDQEGLQHCVHTSIALSAVLGLFVGIFGAVLSAPMLQLMDTDPEVLPLWCEKADFAGSSAVSAGIITVENVPASLVYNFGASILRAVGDTDRPLRFLMVSGVANVILNLILVVVFHMGVAGVAIATVVSQILSAFLVLRCLMGSEGMYRLHLKKLRFHGATLRMIIQIGVPAGLQSTMFSISNVTIQSAINSFGKVTMAGNAAASSVDGFVYIAMNAFYHAALSFMGQNVGAKQKDRIGKVIGSCLGLVTVIGVIICPLVHMLGDSLLTLYVSSTDPDRDAVIAQALIRMLWVGVPYFLCGIMEVNSGLLRGMGKAWTPLIISVLGVCVFRVAWVATIFAWNRSLEVLYASYPVSWALTSVVQGVCLIFTHRKIKKRWSQAQ